MILQSINGKHWAAKAVDKLKSFLSRAPILVTNIVGTENGQDGVFIIPANSSEKLFFPFDYELDQKVWVHNIKQNLLQFYPRIVEPVYEEKELTPIEAAMKLEEGVPISQLPKTERFVTKYNCWRIDKIQVYKDIFILYKEATLSADKELLTETTQVETQSRYKYQGSSVIFMSKYRNNDFATIEEAGEEFFENAIFIEEIAVKNQ